jgi:hypothetical protein
MFDGFMIIAGLGRRPLVIPYESVAAFYYFFLLKAGLGRRPLVIPYESVAAFYYFFLLKMYKV